MDRNDNRSKLQAKLERTRWKPFSFVSVTGCAIRNHPNAEFASAAMMTTAIIAKMLYDALPRSTRGDSVG